MRRAQATKKIELNLAEHNYCIVQFRSPEYVLEYVLEPEYVLGSVLLECDR